MDSRFPVTNDYLPIRILRFAKSLQSLVRTMIKDVLDSSSDGTYALSILLGDVATGLQHGSCEFPLLQGL